MPSKSPRPQPTLRFTAPDVVLTAAWTIMAIAIAYYRSLWGDEWNHVQDLKNGMFWAARELLNKPSPFAPGEAILNGIAQLLFNPFNGPMEIWARLQNIGWAAGAVMLAFSIGQSKKIQSKAFFGIGYLPLFIMFSASLISLATEMRPYSSLFFSGALAFRVLYDGGIKSRGVNLAVWLFFLFGHLYGICFLVGTLILVRGFRHWKKMLFGVAYVLFVLSQVKIVVGQGSAPLPGAADIFKQIVGTLGNPHKASYVFLPLFFLGLYRFLKEDRAFTVKLCLLFAATVLGPLFATISGKYFFVPRQVAAGSFLFLVASAKGLDFLRQRFLPLPAAYGVCLAISALPWTLSTLLKIPPFPNQAMHRFREISKEVTESNAKALLSFDVCNYGPIEDYLGRALGKEPASRKVYTLEGFQITQVCWTRASGLFCYNWPMDYQYCAAGPEAVEPGSKGARLVESGKFDVIFHTFAAKPKTSKKTAKIPWIRTW